MNKSVGAIIKDENGRILMLDRVNMPYGWACPAGHIENNETPELALRREVLEETGLEVKNYQLLFSEYIAWNNCRKHHGHNWHVYEVKTSGYNFIPSQEAKEMRWIKIQELTKLKLEEIWKYWFDKLGLF